MKERKSERNVARDSVEKSVVDSQCGLHEENVFTYWRPSQGEDKGGLNHHPVNFINNTAWQKGASELA